MYKIICIAAEEGDFDDFEEAVTKTRYYVRAGYKNIVIAAGAELVDIYRNGELVYHKPRRRLDKVIDVIATGKCGQRVHYELDELGVLRIFGAGSTFNFNKPSRYETDTPWEALRYNILKVEVEEGVTNLGSCIFANCVDLEYVELPDSLVEVGSEAFFGCSNLLEVNMFKRTKLKGIHHFAECNRLRKVVINTTRTDYPAPFNYI